MSSPQFTVMSAGAENTGAASSTTLMVQVAEVLLPAASVAV